jgi:Fis family transcriptional regulator
MNNIAEIIEKPVVGHVVHGQSEQPLRDAVRHALDNYFAQLAGEKPTDLYEMVLEQIELPLLQKIMEYTGGNQSRAAKILGLSRGTLRKMLKTYDLL